MHTISKNKKGYVLVLAMIIMVVGALMLGVLFSYLETSLFLANRGEETAVTYYAADAGIEEAMWNMLHNGNYSLPADGEVNPPLELTINGKAVETIVTNPLAMDEDIYKITATATGDDGGSTTLESYVMALTLNLSGFGDYAITSNGSINIQPGTIIEGDVIYTDDIDGEENITGNITQDEDGIDWWPPAQDYIDYYLAEVDESTPYPDLTIDAKYTPTIGPLYRQGDLDIRSSEEGATITLHGTIYVTGDLDIGKTGQTFNLDLNGQTIFVESDSAAAIEIGGKTAIQGSGSIIAVGDIFFSPNLASDENNYLFTMSIEGTTTLNPGSTYYGSVAGDTMLNLQPGIQLTWINPADVGYELDMGTSGYLTVSYTII